MQPLPSPLSQVVKMYWWENKTQGKSAKFALNRGDKPDYPPETVISKDDFDQEYRYSNCFESCAEFNVDISASLQGTEVSILVSDDSFVANEIRIDLEGFYLHTPYFIVPADEFIAFDNQGSTGVSWRIDTIDASSVPESGVLDPSKMAGSTTELVLSQSKQTGKRSLSLYSKIVALEQVYTLEQVYWLNHEYFSY